MDEPILTQSEIETLAQKFNLPYQVYQSSICQQLVGFAGKSVLEVGGSLPPEFVFTHLKAKEWFAVETPDYASSLQESGGITHTGTLLGQGLTPKTFDAVGPHQSYNFYLDDIIRLPASLENRFDLVFSLAAFEHIHRLHQALQKMYAALKPGGKLFSLFSPIWSSYQGHHLPDMTDANGNHYNFANSPIPAWGHLLQTPAQMLSYLKTKTDEKTAQNMVYYIYNAPNINRYFAEDFLELIQLTPFTIDRFESLLEVTPYPDDIAKALTTRYPGRTIFDKSVLLIILSKK